jgi:hypothetical protein
VAKKEYVDDQAMFKITIFYDEEVTVYDMEINISVWSMGRCKHPHQAHIHLLRRYPIMNRKFINIMIFFPPRSRVLHDQNAHICRP